MDDLEERQRALAAASGESAGPPAQSAGSAQEPHPRPLRWAIPALCLFVAGTLFWQQRGDLAYLVSESAPIELGGPAGYHLERARPGRFARIEGQPAPEASRYRKGLFPRELLPLPAAPVLVDAPAGTDGRVFEGRLEPDVREPQLAKVVRYFLERDELAPPGERVGTRHVWILTVGQRPWRPGWSAAWLLSLFALVVFNGAWLLRRLER